MNAQSNHPINDTTDPQFLGPEAGQQAGGEEQTYELTATYSPDDNKLRLSSATGEQGSGKAGGAAGELHRGSPGG